MDKKIMTPRGEVASIGEFKFLYSKEFPYEIPRLSYIIIKESEKTYASTCIDLHIDGDGATPKEANKNMGYNVFEFLRANFIERRAKDPSWDFLVELFSIDDNSKVLWDAYNKFKLSLSKRGIVTDAATVLVDYVQRLNEEIDRLNGLDISKEEALKRMGALIEEQNKVIEQLHKEKKQIQAAGAVAVNLATQALNNVYNTSWPKK
jgi:hypothetical protein